MHPYIEGRPYLRAYNPELITQLCHHHRFLRLLLSQGRITGSAITPPALNTLTWRPAAIRSSIKSGPGVAVTVEGSESKMPRHLVKSVEHEARSQSGSGTNPSP